MISSAGAPRRARDCSNPSAGSLPAGRASRRCACAAAKSPARIHARHQIDLQDIPEYMAADGEGFDPAAVETQRGEVFGELAALGRMSRSTTVVASGDDTTLLEIRWQGLRDIRRFSPAWKEMLDERYRRYSLQVHLREARYTRSLASESTEGDGSEFEELCKLTQFHSYGDFEWQTDFRELASADSASRLAAEETIVGQGNQPSGMIMVRSGFVRVRRRYNFGEKTVSYLGKGQSYGLAEIYHNWKKRMLGGARRDEILTFQHTLSAVGYADTLFVPAPVVEKYIIPSWPRGTRRSSRGRSSAGRRRSARGRWPPARGWSPRCSSSSSSSAPSTAAPPC